MENKLQILLFGDQTNSFDKSLRRLLQPGGSSAVTTLLERVHLALRLEIGGLPVSQQQLFPRFSSVSDLEARYRSSTRRASLESAFHCLSQLGWFIRNQVDTTSKYPTAEDTRLVGICTGLLAAAAISNSKSLAELIPKAVDTVLLAFRIGLHAESMSDTIVGHDKSAKSWSLILGMQEDDASAAISSFLQAKNIAPISQPYISAVASNCVTISGPPASLEHLVNSAQFSNIKAAHTSVYAAYHADHIYTLNDVDMILSNSPLTPIRSCTDAIPIFSNLTGKMHSVTEHRALIHTILSEILTEPVRWDRIIDGISADVMASHASVCEILSFGGNATQSLVSGLARDSGPVVEAKEDVWGQQSPANSDRASWRRDQSKIAIIGFSGRYPDAASNEKFWEILHNGRDVHRPIPTDRFDAAAHMDPTGKKRNTSRIGHGCFIEDPGLFDERFFNMSPREAANCDPGQRLAIVTAYEAQEMAGFVTGRTPSTQKDRVGIFYGMTSDDWREVNSGQNIDTYFIPGGNRAFTPGRLNYFFKFSGPSFSVDTACSSSFAAIHTACNSLWQGDCDTAFAGGTNVMTNPDNFAGLDRGHFLSTKGNCNTFDDNADGYCRADGVGTVILKRLEDAEADGDPIQGVLLGAYTNHSADAVSMTRPDAGAQAFIFDQMLNSCNVSPQDISYIEMHGTGTQAGDWTEMRSVLRVFAPAAGKRPNRPLYLGSTKSNIGHAESSSGVLSLIKVLLMMRNNEIPPHCGIKTKINQKFPTDLAERNVHIATKPTDWSRPDGGLRRVFLNNFSAAGGNTALLLEDSPLSTAPALAGDPRKIHVVTVSGKSPTALEKNTRALLKFIAESPALSLPALSYTTTARRIHHSYRTVVCGADLRSISGKLADALAGEVPRAIPAKAGKVAFVFTGQGVLQLEMGKRLFETISQFRSDIINFDQIAQRQGFPGFRGLVDGSLRDQAAISPVVAQLGTTCLQIALFRLWMSWGIQPSVVVGHSLGEYAAFHAAGILSVTDTIYLTGARAQLMIKRCTVGTHCMLAVMISIEELESKWPSMSYEVACVNGPTEVVLSGTIDSIDRLAASLAEGHIKFTKLAVPFAFHSSQVDPILDDFGDLARSVEFGKPTIPYMSPLLRGIVTDANVLEAQYLQKACRGTVDFLSVVSAAKSSGVITDKTAWIEVGSHPICSNMLKQICGTTITALPSMKRGEDCMTTLALSVARLHSFGFTIDWNHYHHDFRSSQTVIRLPTYCWDAKNHWIQYNYNFCLTKGEPVAEEAAASALPLSIWTPSVQHIIEQKLEGQRPMVVMQSDLAEPKLAKVIQSHKVNGVALCPSSLYADIALTLGNHLLENASSSPGKCGLDVADMVVSKPLIATGSSQFFRASAIADWSSRTIFVSYFSVSPEGKKTDDHAHCTVKLGDLEAWLKEWSRLTYLIKSRIETLQSGVTDGKTHLIKKRMAYKLFSSVVEYDTEYQGMQEVLLDSEHLEASAKVVFQTTEADGKFCFNPFWIDSLGHLAGFVMNGNDFVDSKVQVFVNHGWDSMRCAQDFSPSKQYRTYVRMQNIGGTMHSGDVYIFDEDVVVGVYQGVKFQGVPRKILDMLLPAEKSTKTARAPAPKTSPIVRAEAQKIAPAAKIEAPKPSVKSSVEIALLAIISAETSVAVEDLLPDTVFDDIGLDSLLALNITGRLREELDLTVESSLFIDCPTVKNLTQYFSGVGSDVSSVDSESESDPSALSTPPAQAMTSGTSISTSPPLSLDGQLNGLMVLIRKILAQEIGVKQAEIENSTILSDLGLDSLLSLTVMGQLREETDVDLPSDLFATCQSLDEVQNKLGLAPVKHLSTPINAERMSEKLRLAAMRKSHVVQHAAVLPPATSVLLQGSPKTCSKRLFLFPDGSGSSTSYVSLAKIDPNVAVFGLNCPYMRKPEDMKCSLADLTAPYLAEIRRRQPQGPYYLGGWSAGGICAYDAVQELAKSGEEVARLILLDSPFPIGLEKLPPRLYDFFNTCGLFGDGSGKAPPSWLLPHFLAFIDCLDTYRAVPLKSGRPKVFLIWAEDGVCNKPDSPRPEARADDPKEMKWLLNNRTDLGPNGWNSLVGDERLTIQTMKDANHFTMMNGKKAIELSEFLALAMAD